MVEVPGFEKAVQAWHNRSWPNYGFAVLFWGNLVEAVADYQQRLGDPFEKHFVRQEDVSQVRWRVKQDSDTLEIVITKSS